MALLDAISQGLRTAAGVISPEVYQQESADHRLALEQAEQKRQAIAKTLLAQVAQGNVTPQSSAVLSSMGLGTVANALANTPQAQANRKFYQLSQSGLGGGMGGLRNLPPSVVANSPAAQNYLKAYSMLARATAPAPLKAPPTRTVISGDKKIQYELQPDGTWKQIGAGPRFSDKPLVSINTPREVLKASAPLRKEEITALKPVDDISQNISKMNQLLSTDSPAADKQINAALTDLFTKTRNTNMLFSQNRNFGTLTQRLSGFLSQVFTGQYSDAQRAQIRDMINQYRDDLIAPTRQKISDYYKGLAKAGNIPSALLSAPNFYGTAPAGTAPSAGNARQEADSYLNSIGVH